MAKDYARRPNRPAPRGGNATKRGNAPAAAPRGLPGWVGMIVGLSIGLVVAAIIWIERPTKPSQLTAGGSVATGASSPKPVAQLPPVTAPANTALAQQQLSTPATSVKDDGKKPIVMPPKQPSRFGFYEMLPSYEVVIPKEDVNPKTASKSASPAVTAAIAAPGQYLIQVGAYRTRDEAEKGRASLALLGVESRIEQVTIDQTETWFRVRIGPENDLSKAQEIMQLLESNDIKGMLIKVKTG